MTRTRDIFIYSGAWIIYIIFAFSAYPYIRIGVMLYSIPLTMLGGWQHGYRGALATTIITIPFHFIVLHSYSDDPKIFMEALNPFGIVTQLIFSFSTALLKTSQIRYRRLNDSLQNLVAERTRDLEKITNYLIHTRQSESSEFNTVLLEKPHKQLKSMMAKSFLLKQKLLSENHPRAADAANVHAIISDCLRQLQTIEEHSIFSAPITDDMETSIQNLIHQIERVSNTNVIFSGGAVWRTIPQGDVHALCEIIFEAVGNALRHAAPLTVRIGVEETAETSIVYVENDGRPLAPTFKEGMGLALMRYRANKLGASIALKSLKNGDTRAECALPRSSAS